MYKRQWKGTYSGNQTEWINLEHGESRGSPIEQASLNAKIVASKLKDSFEVIKPKKVEDGLSPYLEIGDINSSNHIYILKDKKTPKVLETWQGHLNDCLNFKKDINITMRNH